MIIIIKKLAKIFDEKCRFNDETRSEHSEKTGEIFLNFDLTFTVKNGCTKSKTLFPAPKSEFSSCSQFPFFSFLFKNRPRSFCPAGRDPDLTPLHRRTCSVPAIVQPFRDVFCRPPTSAKPAASAPKQNVRHKCRGSSEPTATTRRPLSA